jgi:tetratricopeptide (TPR) repeat protein
MKKTKVNKARPGTKKSQPAKKKSAVKRPAAAGRRSAKASASSRPRPKPASKGGSKKLNRPAPPPVITRKPTSEEVAHQHAMVRFENALQLFNQSQFSRARAMFERLTAVPSRELAERASVYVRICEQRLSRTTVQLKSAEDYYNYAVGLANEGNPEESEEYLQKALKLAPKADYMYYALATTYALRDDVDGALQYLLKAIELNERNRFQAQNDADFSNLLEDPRFTELLYPEKPLA